MPVCKYFASPAGCSRGDTCYFQHVEPAISAKPDTFESLTIKLQRHDIKDQDPPRAIAANWGLIGSSTTRLPCRFFAFGNCKNGSKCRFSHTPVKEKVGHQEDTLSQDVQLAAQPKPSRAIETSVRDFGGAIVKFGDGAEILEVKPGVAQTARLQMCNVTCSWYQPSKIATLEFSSSQAMNEAAERLRKSKLLNRTLECRTAVNKKTKPWQCFVKVGNLDVSTSARTIGNACGIKKPHKVTFAANSYNSSAQEIGDVVRQLLSSRANVESWNLSADQTGLSCKATATLGSTEESTKIIKDFNGYKLPQLAGSSISLSQMFKAKFSTLTSIYEVIKDDLASVRAEMRSGTFLDLKIYPSNGPFTTIHVISSSPKEVARAKLAVNRVLMGHTATSGHDIVWHQYFLQHEGVAYLNALGKESNVFIYRNAKKCELSLYGPEEQRAVVESTLIKAVEDLALSNLKLQIDEDTPTAVIQAAYRKIVAEFGRSAVKVNIASTPKTFVVEASSHAADRVRIVLDDTLAHLEDVAGADEGSDMCAVCWCDISGDTYTTPCGHIYDKDCFVSQCSSASASDIPIRCLGAEGSCLNVIAFSELELALTRDGLDSLLSHAFTNYIRTNPMQYQYCPTASCDQIYAVTDDCTVFTCSTCLTSICTTCSAVSHEGLTCEQNKRLGETDDAFVEWKRGSGAKGCPKCESTIEKNGGCRHVYCVVCGAHICWVCLKSFDTGDKTYTHLAREHGGIFDVIL